MVALLVVLFDVCVFWLIAVGVAYGCGVGWLVLVMLVVVLFPGCCLIVGVVVGLIC